MRFILKDESIEQVTFMEYEQNYYINPTDHQIDEAHKGYRLQESPQPNPESTPTYALVGGVILQSWEG